MKKRYISLFACTLLSMPAQAAQTAYDGFDYTADEVVVGKNGGSGFSNAWTFEGGSAYTVKADGLSYDELRLSQTSLNEVAPVIPEPTSALLGLVGFAALLRRRR
jgi:uncharacterized protein (TIGR03382 family)